MWWTLVSILVLKCVYINFLVAFIFDIHTERKSKAVAMVTVLAVVMVMMALLPISLS